MSTKKYRPWAPDQSFLLPPSPRSWLPEDHLALFLLEVIERFDLSAIHAAYAAKDPRGERPYAPEMLTTLLLYGYCTGTFSSRKIERATYEDVGFRVIAGDNHPDHATIARFRRRFFPMLADLFVQVVQLCEDLDLVDASRIAVDGTKMAANASKHKAMSYGRMAKKKERLEQEIEQLLEHAEAVDAEEDELYGEEHNGLLRQLPDGLKRREERLAAIDAAMEALEREAREARADELEDLAEGNDRRTEDADLPARQRKAAATRAAKQREQAHELRQEDEDDNDSEGPPPDQSSLPFDDPASSTSDEDDESDETSSSAEFPERRVRHIAAGTPHPKAQRNFTDPDSGIMEHKNAYLQAYNCQIAASEEQIILGHGATNVAPDTYHLRPVVHRARSICDSMPSILLADAGYWAEDNVAYCEEHGIDPFIAIGRERDATEPAPSGADPPQTAHERMDVKVRSERGREQYKDRKWMVEPIFGQIKEAMGFRRFSVRGIDLVRAEWALVCACHNLLKLWRRNALPA